MKCLICQKELLTECEQKYGICYDDSGKVKSILSFAMSFQGIGGIK